jgi:hypothetical protein
MLLGQWSSPSTVPTYSGYGIAFDSSGNVLVVNTFSHRIEKFTNLIHGKTSFPFCVYIVLLEVLLSLLSNNSLVRLE